MDTTIIHFIRLFKVFLTGYQIKYFSYFNNKKEIYTKTKMISSNSYTEENLRMDYFEQKRLQNQLLFLVK